MCYIMVLVQMVNANCILRRRQACVSTHEELCVGPAFPLFDLTIAGHLACC